jgi:lysyl-tRNA synthetase class 2
MNDTSSLEAQRQIRIEKIEKLKKLGVMAYPSESAQKVPTTLVKKNFTEGKEGAVVTVAGRLMSIRSHGHIVFAHVQDEVGSIQLYIKDTDLNNRSESANQLLNFDEIELLDIGDIVEASGVVTKTKSGEISVLVHDLRLLTKAIRPLPDKFKGLADRETMVRQRYLDTIMNPEKKETFYKASEIMFALREFLHNEGFVEITTPILQPVYGGGNAKPFKSYVNALGQNFYLAISHELYLKRLIVAGFDKVFGINRVFRNEGIDRTHNPEFTMLETMTAYENYEYNMDLIENMFRYVAEKVFNKTTFMINGNEIDFAKPWKRIMMVDAVKEFTGIDFGAVETVDEAREKLIEIGITDDLPSTIGDCLYRACEERVEKNLIEPTFLMGHPVEISPLAKRMPSDERYVERFEIYIAGIEHGDNWTELNNPLELFDRFSDQVRKGRGGDDEAHPMDLDFIEVMEYGMPPTTGIGPGIERLLMTFLGKQTLDDVLFFPMLRPRPITKKDEKIYGRENIIGGFDENGNMDMLLKNKKLTIVVREDMERWKLANAIGHISVKLGNLCTVESLHTSAFSLGDGTTLKPNMLIPVITLTAKAGQLQNLAKKTLNVSGDKYQSIIFTQDMIDSHSFKETSKYLHDKEFDDLDIIAVGFIGDADAIGKVTKNYSLLK